MNCNTGRFSSREDPDPSKFQFDPNVDILPDPEDLIDKKGEYHFIGYYCHVMTEYHRISSQNDILSENGQYITSTALQRESALEIWLDRAQDFLPEWVQCLYIREPGPNEGFDND